MSNPEHIHSDEDSEQVEAKPSEEKTYNTVDSVFQAVSSNRAGLIDL